MHPITASSVTLASGHRTCGADGLPMVGAVALRPDTLPKSTFAGSSLGLVARVHVGT
jgi:hypothetical protein